MVHMNEAIAKFPIGVNEVESALNGFRQDLPRCES